MKLLYIIGDDNEIIQTSIAKKKVSQEKGLIYDLVTYSGKAYTRPKAETFSSYAEAEAAVPKDSTGSYLFFILKENFDDGLMGKRDKFIYKSEHPTEIIRFRKSLGRKYLHIQLAVEVYESLKDTDSAKKIKELDYQNFIKQYLYYVN